jgi:aconitate hydratase
MVTSSAVVGSSANPGYRDFAIAAEVLRHRFVHPRVSFDVNPTSRQILENLVRDGHVLALLHAGARLHQAGCNGCIGMGQAPATEKLSLRTVPRNFPGRSGAIEDKVCLVSPETATASAIMGEITDPRTLGIEYPRVREPEHPQLNTDMILAPLPLDEARDVAVIKGPNIKSLPSFDALPDDLVIPALLVLGDNVSTDEIMPAGARILPFRSNLPKISEFVFDRSYPTYPEHARSAKGGHAIVAGANYGQGSSREHAALAPRYLGLRVVLAKSFARIHWQNLVNFGVLPLEFENLADSSGIAAGDVLELHGLRRAVAGGRRIAIQNSTRGVVIPAKHRLSERQIEIVLRGGLINWMRDTLKARSNEAVGARG